MEQIIINQFAGLGDILFIEPIVRKYFRDGYHVIWPVNDDIYWIKDYITYVEFVKKSNYPMDYEQAHFAYEYLGIPVLPVRFSNPIYRGFEPHYGDDKPNWMLDKYRLLHLDLNLWKTLEFTRNIKKEDELFNLLGLKYGQEYNLVNRNYGGGFNDANISIHNSYDLNPLIELKFIEGYTLLDWTKVIENATTIHTVETSIIYLIENLDIKAKEIHLYPRKPWEYMLNGVKNFISKKWKLHEEFIEKQYVDVFHIFTKQEPIINNEFKGFKEDYLVLHSLLNDYNPKSIFEIGTNMGTGTKIMKNAVPNADVYSLDLPEGLSDNVNVGSNCNLSFTQFREDSMTFDYSKVPCEAYFIDGYHDYEHVLHETTEVIKCKPKLIVWHDANIEEVSLAILHSFKYSVDYNLYRVLNTRIAYAIRR